MVEILSRNERRWFIADGQPGPPACRCRPFARGSSAFEDCRPNARSCGRWKWEDPHGRHLDKTANHPRPSTQVIDLAGGTVSRGANRTPHIPIIEPGHS
jgi:hypothetical protein